MTHYDTTGLSTSEVEQRLIQYGKNQLTLKGKKSLVVEFFNQFKDLMVIILMIAAVISFAVGEKNDAIVITSIVILNAIIGFVQEFRAEKAVEALQHMLAPQARVLRDDSEQMIPAEQIVPGDVLILNEGDRIAADAEIFEENECETQESILTGESTPVKKSLAEGNNTIYMSTMVAHGSARAIVTQTGMTTKFGKIANLTTATEKDKSPLEKELDHVGVFVGKLTLVIAVVLMGYGMLFQHDSFTDALVFAAAVAVAAVPEGLPTTITIALAVGVQRLARKHAIVKQLSSVETLGSTTVIVSDKTGTLTRNEMTVTQLMTLENSYFVEGSGYEPTGSIIDATSKKTVDESAEKSKELRLIALTCTLCNHAALAQDQGSQQWSILGDPTEGALLTLAHKLAVQHEEAKKQYELIHELPFDSRRKRMTVIVRNTENGKYFALVKGAPDSMLDVCSSLDAAQKTQVHEQNEQGARNALRMMSFAYKEINAPNSEQKNNYTIANIENNLTYLGICGIIDPPREEVKEAIGLTHHAGIKVYILTGDHGLTAKAIAEKIGLIESEGTYRIITGDDLQKESDEALQEILHSDKQIIFARVSPEDKLRVVTLLKQNGEIVAVTGDGVNDAPALKRADIGVAMGIAGTDVAKEAANMVLADDSFSTIITAIQEGRTIYENLKKFIVYMFSSNMGELFVIFLADILGFRSPVTAITMLLINIGTDILPSLALGIEPGKIIYMSRPPRNPQEKILRKPFIQRLFFLGTIVGISSLAAFMIATRIYSYEIAVTLTYTTIVIAQMFNAYNARDERESALIRPLSNLYLVGAIVISMAFTFATTEIPLLSNYLHLSSLTGQQWLLSILLGSAVLWAEELRKIWVRSKDCNPLQSA